jgi:uncharacterized Zn finger protein (UPF0148 family)
VRISGTQVWDGRDVSAELPKELGAACEAAVEEFGASHRSSLSSFWGLAGLILWIGIWIGLSTPLGVRDAITLTFIVVVGAVIWEWFRRSDSRRPYDERLLATLLAAARCPSCGYDLEPVRAVDGECSCCPECGAAWRLPTRTMLPLRMPGVSDPVVSEAEHPTKERVSYADGRGRAVWLVDSSLKAMPRAWLAVPVEKRARIEQRLRDRAGVERAGYFFGGLVCLVLGTLHYVGTNWNPIASVAITLVFGLLGLGGFWLALTSKRAGDGQAIAQIFLNSWVCPSCATLFENPQEEPDGCITCPTCRAAWRVEGAVAMSPGTV